MDFFFFGCFPVEGMKKKSVKNEKKKKKGEKVQQKLIWATAQTVSTIQWKIVS